MGSLKHRIIEIVNLDTMPVIQPVCEVNFYSTIFLDHVNSTIFKMCRPIGLHYNSCILWHRLIGALPSRHSSTFNVESPLNQRWKFNSTVFQLIFNVLHSHRWRFNRVSKLNQRWSSTQPLFNEFSTISKQVCRWIFVERSTPLIFQHNFNYFSTT